MRFAECLPLLVIVVGITSRKHVAAQPLNSIFEGIKRTLKDYSWKPDIVLMEPQPMLVIGAGLPRTGTGSLHKALSRLGYKTYHMMTVYDDSRHSTIWAQVARGETKPGQVFEFMAREGFNATLDYPASDYFELQHKLNPNAKVILSVRDNPQKWAESFSVLREFVALLERPFSLSFPTPLPLFLPKKCKELSAIRCNLGTQTLGLDYCEIKNFKRKESGWLEELYNQHVAKVKEIIPFDQLLVFNVKEGWQPLCQFLNTTVPNEPFPNVGESKFLQKAAIVYQVIVYAWIPFALLILASLLNCMPRFLKKGKAIFSLQTSQNDTTKEKKF